MRCAVTLAALVMMIFAASCGGGNDDAEETTPTPAGTLELVTYSAPTGCVEITRPQGWYLNVEGDVNSTISNSDCPGGLNIEGEVAECTGETIDNARTIISAGILSEENEPLSSAFVVLHGARKRCDTLEDHLAQISESSGGNVQPSGGGEIAGYPAICAEGTRSFDDIVYEARTCVAEIEGKLYQLTVNWETTLAAELEPLTEAVAASLKIAPIDPCEILPLECPSVTP